MASEWGRQGGAGPRAFAFPTHSPASKHRGPRPTPGRTHLPTHPRPPDGSPSTSSWGAAVHTGGPRGQGLGGGLGKCSEVSRCYQGGRGQSCGSQSTRPSPAVPAPPPTLEEAGMSVPHAPGRQCQAPPPQPAHGQCPAPMSLGACLCAGGRVPAALSVRGACTVRPRVRAGS